MEGMRWALHVEMRNRDGVGLPPPCIREVLY